MNMFARFDENPAMTRVIKETKRYGQTHQTKIYVVGTQKNHVDETVLLSTQNMFNLMSKKIFTILRSFFCLSKAIKTYSRGQKFHSPARNYKWNLERTSNSSQSTRPVGRVHRMSALGRIAWGSRITYYSCSFLHTLLKDMCIRLQDKWKL